MSNLKATIPYHKFDQGFNKPASVRETGQVYSICACKLDQVSCNKLDSVLPQCTCTYSVDVHVWSVHSTRDNTHVLIHIHVHVYVPTAAYAMGIARVLGGGSSSTNQYLAETQKNHGLRHSFLERAAAWSLCCSTTLVTSLATRIHTRQLTTYMYMYLYYCNKHLMHVAVHVAVHVFTEIS